MPNENLKMYLVKVVIWGETEDEARERVAEAIGPEPCNAEVVDIREGDLR